MQHDGAVVMVTPLATYTKEEQRSVIRFVSSEGVKPIEIHGRMKVQYGDHVCHCRKCASGIGSS